MTVAQAADKLAGMRGGLVAASALAGLVVLACGAPPAVEAPVASSPAAPPPAREVTAADPQVLRDRLEPAHAAMQDMALAKTIEAAHLAAERIVNILAGEGGRHAGDLDGDGRSSGLLPEGLFPADGSSEAAPGLALRLYAAPDPNAALREAISGTMLGDIDAWRDPAARYDEIDRAVATTDRQTNTVKLMDGHLMRAMAWALLTLRSERLIDAHLYASHGQFHTGLSLHAAEQALDAGSTAMALAGPTFAPF